MCKMFCPFFLLTVTLLSLVQISNSIASAADDTQKPSASASASPSPSRLLFFNGFSSKSHLHALEPLAVALATRGHSVTILSTITPDTKHPNITHYGPEVASKFLSSSGGELGAAAVLDRLKSRFNDMILTTDTCWDMVFSVCSAFYSSDEFRRWVKGQQFDLVVIDHTSRECALPLAHIWGAKSIIFNPAPILYGDLDTFGIPLEVSHTFSQNNEPGFLPESLYSDWMNVKWHLWRRWTYLPRFDAIFKEHFTGAGGEMALTEIPPPVSHLEKSVSLYFSNTHFSSEMARSLPPFVQQVGGMHCKADAGENGIADKEIREFIEDPNSDGFIFISFGSFYKVSALPEENLKLFFDAISRFPRIKFLWKWEGSKRENLPKNLFMGTWFPQQDLLAHKKCKGFLSQGGLMSYQQAVFHGVPLILIPFAYDQIFNARSASKIGFGIHLELAELTLDNFSGAIEQLIPENNRYKMKVVEMSGIERDRPMTAVDLGVYWTEYVLRHDNVDHLKSPGINQFWWERRLLHIHFILFALIFLCVHLILRTLSFVRKSHAIGQNGAEIRVKKTD